MVSGQYSGTMCLTEPQCGTDLGLIRTMAKPKDDHYELSGSKIWITFGEHDLTDNIIHLVLAKTPGSPDSTKGISLFLVPKFLPDGQRNPVYCGGLESKMGQHGSPTAVLNFDQAAAWLIGKEHEGMKMMFQMMNPARIGVGVQALGVSEIAYQTALDFASNRRQSRSVCKAFVDQNHSADLILAHMDVRRMLASIDVTNYTMRLLIAYCGYCQDTGDEDRVGLLTPIIKSYVTERSVDNIALSMQVMGGMGYVADGLCEQYYRDARITMIYEGTNGIQALDLLGRKIAKDGGQAMLSLLNEIRESQWKDQDRMQKLKDLLAIQDKANQYLLEHMADLSIMTAIAPSYLNLLALVVQYWLLGEMGDDGQAYIQVYEEVIIPQARLYHDRVLSGTSGLDNYVTYNEILASVKKS